MIGNAVTAVLVKKLSSHFCSIFPATQGNIPKMKDRIRAS